MPSAKDMRLKPIDAKAANAFMRSHHYSHKVVPNSQVHIGAFWQGKLAGVLQFGPSINKKGTINTVPGTGWNEFVELNRMAFTDLLPRNSESRAIAIALRMLKQANPHLKWVLSFADATLCGTGTIYRAAGFKLIGIKRNTQLLRAADGTVVHTLQLYHRKKTSQQRRSLAPVPGYQIKYLYKFDGDYTGVATLPYAELDKLTYPDGVRHKTSAGSVPSSTADFQPAGGGATPTPALNVVY